MSHHLHPLAVPLLPYLQKYPAQAPALFQAYQDLYLAQSWQDLTIIDLPSCECVVLRGRPKTKTTTSFALPMGLTTPTSLRGFSNVFEAILSLSSATAENVGVESVEEKAPMVYLAIVEKDSSIVYYVLRNGIVSPKEVPE